MLKQPFEWWRFAAANEEATQSDRITPALERFEREFEKALRNLPISFNDAVALLTLNPACSMISGPRSLWEFVAVAGGEPRIYSALFLRQNVESREALDVGSLIDLAKSDRDAFKTCKYYAALNLLAPGTPNRMLQDWAGRFLLGEIKEPTRKGPSRKLNAIRDLAIASLFDLAQKLGFQRYKNDASTNMSAGDVVCAVLEQHGVHMSIKAIEKIGPSWTFTPTECSREPSEK